jgi:hypothetical protein
VHRLSFRVAPVGRHCSRLRRILLELCPPAAERQRRYADGCLASRHAPVCRAPSTHLFRRVMWRHRLPTSRRCRPAPSPLSQQTCLVLLGVRFCSGLGFRSSCSGSFAQSFEPPARSRAGASWSPCSLRPSGDQRCAVWLHFPLHPRFVYTVNISRCPARPITPVGLGSGAFGVVVLGLRITRLVPSRDSSGCRHCPGPPCWISRLSCVQTPRSLSTSQSPGCRPQHFEQLRSPGSATLSGHRRRLHNRPLQPTWGWRPSRASPFQLMCGPWARRFSAPPCCDRVVAPRG